MFCSVRRLKKWNESIKMKMFLSADTLLWELVMKDSEWHSERSDKHGSLFTINTGKVSTATRAWPAAVTGFLFALIRTSTVTSSTASESLGRRCLSPRELRQTEAYGNTSADRRAGRPQLQQSQERSKLTAEGTVWVKDVTGWLQWLATQWRAAAVLGLNSWK